MDKIVETLIQNLKSTFQDRLLSVVLYGSQSVKENQDQLSDINLIVILDKLSALDLKAAYPAIKKWKKTQNPLPLFMDKEEWFNSSDVYAIEYSDIIERHKILYGDNFINQIKVEKHDLRLECEAELRDLLIKIRQSYLANSTDKKVIESIVKKSSTSVIAIFRALLRILDISVPVGHKDVINTLSTKFDFDKEVFIQIISNREQNISFSKEEIDEIVQRLINSLNQVLIYVDQLDTTC